MYIDKDGSELQVDEATDRAYNALANAANQIQQRVTKALYEENGDLGRYERSAPYYPTPEHRDIVDAMPKLLAGQIDVETAMAIVGSYEAVEQRFGKPRKK